MKKKQKPKVESARKFRGINFIDPEDKEFAEIIEHARKNGKYRPQLLCFAKGKKPGTG